MLLLGGALAGVASAQDPLLGQQWHLRDRDAEPAGADVLAAWTTTRGLGVVIGIVDDGVQVSHPDLAPNLNLTLSTAFSFNGSAAVTFGPGTPLQLIPCNPALLGAILGDGCRGTAIGGIAAARDNTIGVSGVAPRATLAALRLLTPSAPDFFAQPGADGLLAAALTFRNDAIHVKNFSWGARDDGATLQALGPLAETALGTAAVAGRGGRGTVIVRAAGDGGPFDNCNFDGFANHRFVLAVGAVGDDALPAPYSESCSALFVVAPSSGGTRSITTTDLLGNPGYDPAAGDYTDRFGGTAAAAPIASGVVALMLAARPDLTERDVKHILVRTAVQIQPADPTWTTGPFPHSEVFGFGLVDAAAAVAAARSWTLVDPEEPLIPLDPTVVATPIPDGGAPVTSTIQFTPATSPFTVEHIEVFVDIDHPRRGDLEITLVSPNGITESHLATLRPDDVGADFDNWRFGTVRHWGEEAQGTWTLRVADRVGGNGQVGTFNSWTMRIYGTAGAPNLTAAGHVRSPSGAPLTGVTLTFARDGGGAVPAPVQTDASGAWSQSGFVNAPGFSYTVTPSRAGLTFTPASLAFNTDRDDLDFVGTPGCSATPIAPGQTLSGTLATTDCRSTQRPDSFADRFTFTGTVGQQVALSLTSATFDPFLFLLRANASTAVAFNDDSGVGVNSRIPATSGFITLPATDTYTIEATSFAPGAVGTYMVSLTAGTGFGTFGNVSVAGGGPLVGVTLTFTRSGGTAPSAVQTDSAGAWTQTGFTPGVTYTVTPSRAGFTFTPPSRTFTGPGTDVSFVGTSAACAAAPITSGQTVSGTLTAGDCLSPLRPGAFADRYSFTGGTAQQIAISVTSATLDTYVYLLQPGQPLPIAENDDSGITLGSRIPVNAGFFTLPADASYTIEVTTFAGGATGGYTLSLTTAPSTGVRAAGRVTTTVPGGGTVGLAGVTIGFSRSGTTGALPAAVITDATGSWSQSGFSKSGEIYTATPSRTNYTFEPPSLQFGNNSAGLNFVATARACDQPLIAAGQTNGTLTANDCFSTQRTGAFADQYTLNVATPVAISLNSTAFDTYLYVLSGATVVASNDDSGGTTNSRVPAGRGFVTLTAGTYVIEVTSYLPGAIGAYTLGVTAPTTFTASGRVLSGGTGLSGVSLSFTRVSGAGPTPASVTTDGTGAWTQPGFTSDSTYRVAPTLTNFAFSPVTRDFDSTASSLDFTGCTATSIGLNQILSGMLAATDCRASRRPQSFADRYTFTVPPGSGQQVAIAMTSTAFDTYLFLETADGTPVAENDDSNGTRSSRIPFNSGVLLLAPGTYVIQASSFNPATIGAYTLSLTGPPVGSFIAAGRVTANGAGLAGVAIGFSGGSTPVGPAITDATGAWISGALTGTYTVTPSKLGFDFTPTSASVSGPSSAVNFTGAPSANCPVTSLTSLSQTVTGALDTNDCRADNRLGSFAERYRFTVPPGGQQVAITLTSAAFDPYLYLIDRTSPGSPVVVATDDDGGGGSNSRIPSSFGFASLPAGDYEIQVTSFSSNATGAYTLTVSSPGVGLFAASGLVTNTAGIALGGVTMTFARVGGGTAPAAVMTAADGTWFQTGFASSGNFSVTPSRAGFGFAPATRFFTGGDPDLDFLDFTATCPRTPIAIGQTLSGTITATDCRALGDDTISADQYVFMGAAGAQVVITMTSAAFDTFLALYGPDGSLLAFNDDFSGTNSRIPDDTVSFTLPDSGQYVVEASPFQAGLTGAYTVSVTGAPGGFEFVASVADQFGSPLPGVTIAFSRVSGTGPIPAAVQTDSNGVWSQSGFAFGTTYRATPSLTNFVASPPARPFAAPNPDPNSTLFDFVMLPAAGSTCQTAAITANAPPLTRSLDTTDCQLPFVPEAYIDLYSFTASAGARVQISLSSSNFDTFLVLYGPDGRVVDFNDDFSGSDSQIPESGGFLTLPLTGQYIIEASSFDSGFTGAYTIGFVTGPSGPPKPSAPAPAAAGAEITAQFWTPVGEGAASGDGISGDDTAGAGPPSMAVDPVNGDIYVAWESGTSEIFVKRWNGATWVDVGFNSSVGAGVSNTSGQSKFPSIIVKQATLNQPGRPVVAWIDDTSGNWEIYIREFDGNTWVPAGADTAASGGGISNAAGAIVTAEAGRPSLVAERANLFVAWATDSQASSVHRVVVSSLRPFMGWAPLSPSALSPNVAVPAQEYASGYQGARTGAVGIFSDGNPIAVYVTGQGAAGTDFADIHVRRWTPITWGAFPAGAATNAGIGDPAPPGSSQMAPRLAMGPDGAPHAAWVIDDGAGSRRILVRRYSSAGSQWRPLGTEAGSGDIFVGNGGIAALSIAIGRDNLPVVAWSDSGSEIFVRKFSPTAGWHEVGAGSATGAGISDTAGLSRFPVIAIDTHQNLNVPIVAWLDSSDSVPQIYVRRAVSNADLVVDSVAVTPPAAGASAGQPVDVSIVVRNRGAVAAVPFSVGVFLSTDSTIDPGADRSLTMQQVAGLPPTQAATINLRVMLPADVTPGRYFIGAVADVTNTNGELDDANNALAGSGFDIGGPDLVVTDVNGPFTATPGQPIGVAVTVKNQAPPPGAAAASRAAIYLSDSPVAGSGRRLGTAQINALAPGTSQTVTVNVNVPADLLPGTYFIAAVADDEQQVAETDENNNGFNAERTIDVVRPDLVVTRVLAPAVGAPGGSFLVTSDVKNQATAPPAPSVNVSKGPPPQPVVAGTSPRFRLNFFLTTNGVVQPDSMLLGSRDVDRLAPGTTSSTQTSLTLPGNVSSGSYFIVTAADGLAAVQEQDETNNMRAASNAMQVIAPDLTITALRGPALGAAGQPLAVSVTVKNLAQAPANPPAFRIGLYLSTDPEPGTGRLIGFVPVPKLPGGSPAVVLSATPTVPVDLLDNDYFLSAVADVDGVVVESDETNNGFTAAAMVTIARPDLIVTSLSGPAVGAAGGPLAVTVGVKNQGMPPAGARPFRVGFFMSAVSAAPGAGVLVGNVSVNGLNAGATMTVMRTITLPGSLADGTYFLSAVVDDDDRVPESDETNNGFTAPAMVAVRLPDLVMTAVNVPASAGSGQPLPVTLEVKNLGPAPANAGAFRIGVFMVADGDPAAATPGAGTLIGNVSVSGVAAGATVRLQTTVPVPGGALGGAYRISAVADPEMRAGDSDRSNNGLVAATPVTIARPDLLITSLTGTTPTASAQRLTVTAMVKNGAPVPADAGPFRVGFFLAPADDPDNTVLIGATAVASLRAGQQAALSAIALTLPANVSAGMYVLSAVADLDDVIAEDTEVNNRFTGNMIEVRRPDLIVPLVTAPPAWSTGQPFVVTARVRNQAPAPAAAGAFRVGAYLSTLPDPGTGVLVGSTAVTSLAPQTNASVMIQVTVPPSLAAGSYFVSVVADYEHKVAESDAGNNGTTATAPVDIRRADLRITALTPPVSGVIARTISVSNTVANFGNAPASAVRVSFFLSPVSAVPGQGRLIGTRDVATLGPVGSPTAASTVATMLTLPANLDPGSYFLSAVVDVAGTVVENDDTNNGLTAPGQILLTVAP